MRCVHLTMVASLHPPSQFAVAHGFSVAKELNYFDELSATLKRNRDRISAALIEAGLS